LLSKDISSLSKVLSHPKLLQFNSESIRTRRKMNTRSSTLLLILVSFLSYANGHSQMICANYNTQTGACSAPIRNEEVAFEQEAYLYTTGSAICQSPMTNPISASYSNGPGCPDYAPCPSPMGSYTAGESFTIMWYARNHATPDQDPATVYLYMSPVETETQGADVTDTVMFENLLCSGPFMNCGGVNNNTNPCTLACTMPTNTAQGVYTLWWKWNWQGVMYTTCADINVAAKSSGSSSGSSSSSESASTTAAAKSLTTGHKTAVTTGVQPATTGAKAATTGAKAATTAAKSSTSSKGEATTGAKSVTTGAKQQQSVTTGCSSQSAISPNVNGVSGSDDLCYLPNTPNLDGTINRNPPTCGPDAPGSRCAVGQCCSATTGLCGPMTNSQGQYIVRVGGTLTVVSQAYATEFFCNGTNADYRQVACSSLDSDDIEDKTAGSNTIVDLFQLRFIIVISLFVGIFARY